MARIAPLDEAQAPPEAQEELKRQRDALGRITNMTRTLAHSPAALRALMQWYPLCDEVSSFLGKRMATLFAHAVSTRNDCLICSTYFRKALRDAGEDPDRLRLDPTEQAVVEFGRQLAADAHGVSDEMFARLASFLTNAQVVALVAFGGMMIATNIFNNALEVDLDDYLQSYRLPPATGATPTGGRPRVE